MRALKRHLLALPLVAGALAAVVACRSSTAETQGVDERASPADGTPAGAAATESRSVDARPIESSLRHVERVTGGADPSDPLVVVVAIHGLGDTAESFAGLFDGFPAKCRLIVPEGPRPWGVGAAWLAGRSSPQRVPSIRDSTGRVAELIRSARASRPDGGRAIVTGFSQGGVITYALAAGHPELVRAAVPMAGVLPRELWPRARLAESQPVVVRGLHGALDVRMPVVAARRSVARFESLGWDARLTVYPSVGHELPSQMRDDLWSVLAELLEADAQPSASPRP